MPLGSFSVGYEDSVISEEEVTEQLLMCSFVGMQSPELKQTAINMVADVYSTVIVKVLYDLFKHHVCGAPVGSEPTMGF